MVSEDLSARPGGVIPILLGPTGSGKTALALGLAERLPIEVISCDSVQVYRGFDIGSSKATPAEQARVVHHLIDVVDPGEAFDAGAWARLADEAIAQIRAAGKIPLVVVGSGLYLRALLHGLAPVGEVPDEVRRGLEERCAAEGIESLHQELCAVDPVLGEKLERTDRQRVLRALAVFEATGERLSDLQRSHRFAENRYDAAIVGVQRPREELHRRIEARVHRMVAEGFIEEVRGILEAGVPRDSRPMLATGYRQVAHMLETAASREETIEAIQRAHRRYAKRQMTWFRSLEVEWIDPEDVDGLAAVVLRAH